MTNVCSTVILLLLTTKQKSCPISGHLPVVSTTETKQADLGAVPPTSKTCIRRTYHLLCEKANKLFPQIFVPTIKMQRMIFHFNI